MSREQIYADVSTERAAQDNEFSGPDHDDKHHAVKWCNLIEYQLGWARGMARGTNDDPVLNRIDGHRPGYRECMVKAAALVVAAIESHDRLLARKETP